MRGSVPESIHTFSLQKHLVMTDPTHENPIKITRLDGFRVLIIGGPDRVEFLQGQLTQDITTLEAAGTALAGWATVKGRLLAVGQLIAAGDEIWWPLPADIVESVARRLQMFVLRAQVKIVQSEIPVAGIIGVGGLDALDIAGENVPLNDRPQQLTDGGLVMRVTGDPNRAWLIGPAAEASNLESADESEWVLQSIRSGVPFIVAATQEQFVPQMLNLDRLGAISFEKGCYVGQEIVARTQNLGRIKRRMFGFSAEGAASLEPGTTIYGPDNSTGKVALSVTNGTVTELLAVIAIDLSQGQWFADQEQTLRLTPTKVPYD
jgi:folate-binding protein YgfZ